MAEFKNPQQDPGMEKRLLLVFALTFVLLMAVQPLLMKYVTKKTPAPASAPVEQQPSAPAVTPSTAPPPASAVAAPSGKQATAEAETVVENGLYRITFTNKGAQVKSWILKKYDDDHRRPLELINASAAAQHGYPMSLYNYDDNLRQKLNSVLYVAIATGAQRTPSP